MKKILKTVVLFIISIFIFMLSSTQVKAEQQKDYVVVTKDNSSCDKIAEKYEENLVESGEDLTGQDILTMELTSAEVNTIEDEKGVTLIEEDIEITANSENIKAEDIKQWNLQAINTDNVQMGNDQVKVALIDSGISYSDDIAVTERICFVPGEEEISELYEDVSGHGTAMAGMIAAQDNDMGITGIASGVDLYSLKD